MAAIRRTPVPAGSVGQEDASASKPRMAAPYGPKMTSRPSPSTAATIALSGRSPTRPECAEGMTAQRHADGVRMSDTGTAQRTQVLRGVS